MDAGQIKSVVSNLVLNAVDSMQQGGSLFIVTRFYGDTEKAMLEVTDTGHGIKKEEIGLIFDPFFTTKEAGRGTGLGLSVTYSIIEGHGGTISVRSEEGKGTTFTVELPVK